MNQPTLFDARTARDEGIRRSRKKNSVWLAKALSLLPAMKAAGYSDVTGEEMRIFLRSHACDLEEPSSPHAWGMLIRTAMKRGLITDTGRQKQMWTEKSHARRTPVWRLV